MPTLDGKDVKITVDQDKCTACGLCIKVCPCEYLELADKKVMERSDALMGCLTCGQCSAICPTDAIRVQGEGLNKDDIVEFATRQPADYDQLFRRMAGRRSIRHFIDKPVAAEDISRILEAAQQAPAGLPPSTVKCVVIAGKEKVRSFAFDFLDEVGKIAWLFSKAGVWLLRPFMSAAYHQKIREKVAPLYLGLLAGRAKGEDYLFYDAPLVMVFLSSGKDIDAAIGCTYAMLAAESLGLGSCMIGTVTPMLARTGKEFRGKYQIPEDALDGIAIIFGHPKFKFQRGVRRRFADILRP